MVTLASSLANTPEVILLESLKKKSNVDYRDYIEVSKSLSVSTDKPIFVIDEIDKISGKPILVEQSMKNILLMRKVVAYAKDEHGKTKEVVRFLSLCDKYDARYHGNQTDYLIEDFWLYNIISDGRKYFLLAKDEIKTNEICDFYGLNIRVENMELDKSLNLKGLSNLFICLRAEPRIKVITPNELTNLTKDITKDELYEYVFTHTDGSKNHFPEESENLSIAQILSGKVDGFPLSVITWGEPGTAKSRGKIETMQEKFQERAVFGGDTSRLKGLIPSFKEKIVQPGFILSCTRIAPIDELGKIVENINRAETATNCLGELNNLIEHKEYTSASGNGQITAKPTSKLIVTSNKVGQRHFFSDHVGLIDPTTLSRFVNWVQDKEEVKFVRTNGIQRVAKPSTPIPNTMIKPMPKNANSSGGLGIVLGRLDRDNFLTIYDSCQTFTSVIDDTRIERLNKEVTSLIKNNQNLLSIWNPRCYHHIFLIVDGLCKIRCLFEDHTSDFVANEIDYERAERILVRMAQGWSHSLVGGDN